MATTDGSRSRGQLVLDGAAWGTGFVLTSLIVGGLAKMAWNGITKKKPLDDDDDGDDNEITEGEDD